MIQPGLEGKMGREHSLVAIPSSSFDQAARGGKHGARAQGDKSVRDGTEEVLSRVMENRRAELGVFLALKVFRCQLVVFGAEPERSAARKGPSEAHVWAGSVAVRTVG